MMIILRSLMILSFLIAPLSASLKTSEELIQAIFSAKDGSVIELAAGTFEVPKSLTLKSGMTLKGAGIDDTIITHAPEWKPSTKTLPDPEMKTKGLDDSAYLIRLENKAEKITISGLTLLGPQLHGAIYGFGNKDFHLHHVRVKDVLWSGVRTFSLQRAKIHDCEFIDAGGRWKRGGILGMKGGITGGAIFSIWMKDSEIWNNRFVRVKEGREHEFYGIKGRQGKRCRIHHNTIGTNFSIEFPFENDEDIEIDHNVLNGAVSIPKYAGGPVPKSGKTFHIHHNYFTTSYAIEFVRNGVEINHNFFDFSVEKDGGNLISAFGKEPAKGPAVFHNNLVRNPGRGVMWMNEPYANLDVRNNHIKTKTTVTPRDEGLFGFNEKSDFASFRFEGNLIECEGLSRPLFRNEESRKAIVKNNRFVNVSDSSKYENPKGETQVGLEASLKFQCGVNGESTVDGWTFTP